MENSIDITLVITIAGSVLGISLPFLAIINALALSILNSLKDSDRQQWERIRYIEEVVNKMIGRGGSGEDIQNNR